MLSHATTFRRLLLLHNVQYKCDKALLEAERGVEGGEREREIKDKKSWLHIKYFEIVDHQRLIENPRSF